MAKTCDHCGSDALTYELDEDCKLLPTCLACGCRGAATEKDPDVPTNPLSMAAAQPRALSTTKRKRLPHLASSQPFNVLAAAKARVRDLEREISRLKKLENECGQLKRLLAAAKLSKSGAVLPLRKAQ